MSSRARAGASELAICCIGRGTRAARARRESRTSRPSCCWGSRRKQGGCKQRATTPSREGTRDGRGRGHVWSGTEKAVGTCEAASLWPLSVAAPSCLLSSSLSALVSAHPHGRPLLAPPNHATLLGLPVVSPRLPSRRDRCLLLDCVSALALLALRAPVSGHAPQIIPDVVHLPRHILRRWCVRQVPVWHGASRPFPPYRVQIRSTRVLGPILAHRTRRRQAGT